MSFRIPNDPCLFDPLAFRIHLARTSTDGFKRDRLPVFEQLIDGRFDQIDGPLLPGLMVLFQPGTLLLWRN